MRVVQITRRSRPVPEPPDGDETADYNPPEGKEGVAMTINALRKS